MAVRLSDLNIQISSPEINLLHPENADFLRGDRAEPSLGNLWDGWVTISYIVMSVGALVWVVLAVLLLSEWIWGSSFVSKVEGVIDGLKGDTISYHYTVDGVRYDKQEPARSYSSSHENGGVSEPAVYLNLAPSQSILRDNVQPPSLFIVVGILGFIASFPLSSYFGLRAHRRLTRILDEATHLIEGVINLEFNGG